MKIKLVKPEEAAAAAAADGGRGRIRATKKAALATVGKDDNKASNNIRDDDYGAFRLGQLREAGLWSGLYPPAFARTHTLSRVRELFGHLAPGGRDQDRQLRVAGRVHSVRVSGRRLFFVDIRSDEGHLQVGNPGI